MKKKPLFAQNMFWYTLGLACLLGGSYVVEPYNYGKLYGLSPYHNARITTDLQALPIEYPIVDNLLKTNVPINMLYKEDVTHKAVRQFFSERIGDKLISDMILYQADEKNLPMEQVFALAYVESGYSPYAVNYNVSSQSFDYGLFQLNNKTFQNLSTKDFFHVETNIDHGTDYLAYAYSLTDDQSMAIAVYNAGPRRPLRGMTPRSTIQYMQRIEQQAQQILKDFNVYMRIRYNLPLQTNIKNNI